MHRKLKYLFRIILSQLACFLHKNKFPYSARCSCCLSTWLHSQYNTYLLYVKYVNQTVLSPGINKVFYIIRIYTYMYTDFDND